MNTLTHREQSVILLAAQGKTDKEIARELFITVATVRTYWDRAKVKLGAINRVHMVALMLGGQTSAALWDGSDHRTAAISDGAR